MSEFMNENNEQRNDDFSAADTMNNGWSEVNGESEGARKSTGSRKQRKQKKAVKILAFALVCCLLGSAVGAGGAILATQANASSTSSAATVITNGTHLVQTASITNGSEMSAADVYENNVNSTVGITTSIVENYWGYQTTAAASGSGFIVSADGYILTNYHVIEDSSSVKVSTYDGQSYDATIVGYDESNDIAVLKINATGLTPVVLGDSDSLRVGDDVVAIGNPLGELTFSLTKGIVSALNRSVTISSGVTMNLIQTDCAINSGNSGGALFNMYGEVIGITNAKYSSSSSSSEAEIDNIGFAIPINTVKNIVSSIISTGTVQKAYIGISVISVSSDYQAYGLPAGAAIASVTDNSPASKAGLQENDIITEVNGKAISSADELVAAVSGASEGDVETFTVYRQGETITVEVTVEMQTKSATAEVETTDEQTTTDNNGTQDYSNPFGSFGYGYGSGSDQNSGNGYGYGYGYGNGNGNGNSFGNMFGYGTGFVG